MAQNFFKENLQNVLHQDAQPIYSTVGLRQGPVPSTKFTAASRGRSTGASHISGSLPQSGFPLDLSSDAAAEYWNDRWHGVKSARHRLNATAYRVPRLLGHECNLSPAARAVGVTIALVCVNRMHFNWSVPRLADWLRIGLRRTRKGLIELEASGLLRRKRTGRNGSRSTDVLSLIGRWGSSHQFPISSVRVFRWLQRVQVALIGWRGRFNARVIATALEAKAGPLRRPIRLESGWSSYCEIYGLRGPTSQSATRTALSRRGVIFTGESRGPAVKIWGSIRGGWITQKALEDTKPLFLIGVGGAKQLRRISGGVSIGAR